MLERFHNWLWIVDYDFRFNKFVELLHICFFDFGGGLNCNILSLDVVYRVVFVHKLIAIDDQLTAIDDNSTFSTHCVTIYAQQGYMLCQNLDVPK